MRLSEYLDRFSWSQADLAREADINSQTVARALSGDTISRRNANAIVRAVGTQWTRQGMSGHITLASIRGLHITGLRRKRTRPAADNPIATHDQTIPINDQSVDQAMPTQAKSKGQSKQ
jgi:hypothetical protein